MTVTQRLTKDQKAQIAAEKERYKAAKNRAAENGEKFDPLNDAPTYDGESKDPVKLAIQKIWYGRKKR